MAGGRGLEQRHVCEREEEMLNSSLWIPERENLSQIAKSLETQCFSGRVCLASVN